MADYLDKMVEQMVEAWQSPIVARTEAPKFSGGAVSVKLLANCDSLGTGPNGKFYVGRKAVYPKIELANWLRSRASK